MDAVQRLRARAQTAGNLRSSPQQVVSASGYPAIITILPARPDVIYVPIYNPTVIYGAWPYPNYQPYYWHPPRYAVSGPVITFGGALIVGSVLWSTYDWRQRRFNVNVNRYNRFNRTRITSERWHQDFEHRRVAADRNAVVRERFDNQRRNNAPTRERFNQERGNQAMPDDGRNRDRNLDNGRRGNENEAPLINNRTESLARPQSQRENRTPSQSQKTQQPQAAPHLQARPQSRPDQPQARPQSQAAPQSRPTPQMRSQESHRSPSTERPANITRTPREAGNNGGGNGYGNRGGGRNETARQPEQRQAQPQERRAPHNENSGGRGKKDRD